ncbi:MAG: MFS transporter [Deltaproteobacteria bacterium]|nr:MFS transporter [Deltaproteobacteria bacterium]
MVAPLPFLLMGVSSWGWFHAANVMLGLSHGLIGSATLIWMIDLAGPARRGWAAGLHGAAGAGAMALSAHVIRGMVAGQCLRPNTPLAVGVGYVLLGAVLVATLSRQPGPIAAPAPAAAEGPLDRQGAGQRSADTSGRQPALGALDLAGFVHKSIDGMAWGLLSRAVLSDGLDRATVGALLVVYPVTAGLGQLLGGALSDRVGRRPLILGGMVAQALAIVGVAAADAPWAHAAAAALLGLGAAALSPALLAAVSDLAAPARRASAIGAHRLWRELGFVAGAVLAVLSAEAVGTSATLLVGGGIALGGGLWVGVRVWGWGGGGADLG